MVLHACVENACRRAFRKALAGIGPAIIANEGEGDLRAAFARSVANGLGQHPRRVESRFLYDARGSALFEEITEQPEYYLTRTESSILASSAYRIRDITGQVTIVELGSGSSSKTGYLLRAWLDRGTSVRYVPVDVSRSALHEAYQSLAANHPAVKVIGINAHYNHAIPLLREASPAMAVFLGSSIGNFNEPETDLFLFSLSEALSPGDYFLGGFDLVKDPAVIEAAYNDAAGVTAAFTRNLFARMNRELDAGIDMDAVEHVAGYDLEREQVEIYGRFKTAQVIDVVPLGKSFKVAAGECIQTEISRKFRIERLIPRLESHGMVTREVFTDLRDWFALILLQKAGR